MSFYHNSCTKIASRFLVLIEPSSDTVRQVDWTRTQLELLANVFAYLRHSKCPLRFGHQAVATQVLPEMVNFSEPRLCYSNVEPAAPRNRMDSTTMLRSLGWTCYSIHIHIRAPTKVLIWGPSPLALPEILTLVHMVYLLYIDKLPSSCFL